MKLSQRVSTFTVLTIMVGTIAATWFELTDDHNAAVFCLLVAILCATLERRESQ